ncbi:hypothetical protein, partial [Enterocloster clostridioformis]|uniref:hypothetical protein n=1 Tax=Enterocloster clostridioformis TaxID=1531 RepID=UPI00325C3400
SDDFPVYLLDCLNKQFVYTQKIEYVMWFHLTRTLNPDSYYKGIYPLNLISDSILENCYSLVADKVSLREWKKICETGSGGDLTWIYKMKRENKIHFGPYAMLVKEAAYCYDNIGNHDYLSLPELIEDLGRGMDEIYGINLIEEYRRKSVPTIIKFKMPPQNKFDNRTDDDYIETAISYLHTKIHNEEMSLNDSTCFNGEGIVIPAENIIYVEVQDNERCKQNNYHADDLC